MEQNMRKKEIEEEGKVIGAFQKLKPIMIFKN